MIARIKDVGSDAGERERGTEDGLLDVRLKWSEI